MKSGPARRLTYLFFFLVVASFAVMVFSCAGEKTAEWTEEVRLDDGSIIKVIRKDSFKKQGELFAPSMNKVRAEITFEGSPAAVWSSEYLDPLIVGYHEGNPYVLSTFNICMHSNEADEPIPPYMTQIYANKKWVDTKPTWLPNYVGRNLATGRHNMNVMPIKYKDEFLVQMTRGWPKAFTGYHIDAESLCFNRQKLGEKQ